MSSPSLFFKCDCCVFHRLQTVNVFEVSMPLVGRIDTNMIAKVLYIHFDGLVLGVDLYVIEMKIFDKILGTDLSK